MVANHADHSTIYAADDSPEPDHAQPETVNHDRFDGELLAAPLYSQDWAQAGDVQQRGDGMLPPLITSILSPSILAA